MIKIGSTGGYSGNIHRLLMKQYFCSIDFAMVLMMFFFLQCFEQVVIRAVIRADPAIRADMAIQVDKAVGLVVIRVAVDIAEDMEVVIAEDMEATQP